MAVGSFRNRSINADINITPLLDIMLTVLIMFIIVAPTAGQQGVDVDLPEAAFAPLDSKELEIVVSVTKSGDIYVNKLKMDIKSLEAKLSKIFENNPNKQIYFKVDKNLPYGVAMKTMAVIKKAGIEKIGMITEPDE